MKDLSESIFRTLRADISKCDLRKSNKRQKVVSMRNSNDHAQSWWTSFYKSSQVYKFTTKMTTRRKKRDRTFYYENLARSQKNQLSLTQGLHLLILPRYTTVYEIAITLFFPLLIPASTFFNRKLKTKLHDCISNVYLSVIIL